MPSLNSLVTQPNSPEPPDVQGSSGTAPGSGLDSVLQKPNGGGAPSDAMQPPSHHETVAVLQHISAFNQRWKEILSEPDVGKANVRGQIMDVMADMIADDYVTLPQVMTQLKTLPTEPLEQKQWLEQHVANGMQAMAAVRQHYLGSRPPMGSFEDEMAATRQAPDVDRSQLVNGLMGRYKAHPKKPTSMKGIPLRG